MAVENPFVNSELRVPKAEWDSVRRYTMTFREESGKKPDVDRSPFRRYVDLWWAAMCVGVQEGFETEAPSWHTFVTGAVLSSDPWRVRQLEILALGVRGVPEVLRGPGEIIRMANGYAATGIPMVIDEMAGDTQPIWAISEFLERRCRVKDEGPSE